MLQETLPFLIIHKLYIWTVKVLVHWLPIREKAAADRCKTKYFAWTAQRQSLWTESRVRFEVPSRSNLSAELLPVVQSQASILLKTAKWQQLPKESPTKNNCWLDQLLMNEKFYSTDMQSSYLFFYKWLSEPVRCGYICLDRSKWLVSQR